MGSTNRAVSFGRRFVGRPGIFRESRYCSWPRTIAAIVVAFMIPNLIARVEDRMRRLIAPDFRTLCPATAALVPNTNTR
jgi:hypothetical protein